MLGRHLVRGRGRRRGPGAALLAVGLAACGAAARQANVDPRAHPPERFVVGRVQMFRAGEAARVTKATSGLGSLSASGPLTTLSLRDLGSGARFAIPIEDDQGWFAAQLPPGSYGVGMTYYIWFFDIPARVEVPTDPARCYLGTLGVNLFARASAAGAWARAAGGAIPPDDIDAAVADQRAAAAAYTGMALPACLIASAATPPDETTRPPPPDGGGSR